MASQRNKILIVDDDPSHRAMLRTILKREGYEVSEAGGGGQGVEMVRESFYDLILMDLRMEDMDGIEALKEIKKISPAIPILIMTAYASVSTAVDSLKLGAYDYLTKPLDMDKVLHILKQVLEHYRLEKENRLLKERLGESFDYSRIIGRSKKMKDIFEVLALVSPSEATVLITGESGTGKELIANAIHQNSPRANRPFIKVNCAALNENLLESELFGHERGAFTGAANRREGRFELAHGGTIFLDEIGDMSLTTQAKILRVLQEKEFERLGGTKTLKVDVRIIAATNKELKEEVRKGRFREDLYYRLSVVPIEIPPLRQRKEDIPELAEHFLKVFRERNQRLIKGFQPRTMDLLMRYDWPGNIRELENTIEKRGVILSKEEYLTPEELPLAIRSLAEELEPEDSGIKPGYSLKEIEKELIIKTLAHTDGNRSKTAEILGITRQTLLNKLKEYGIN
jgi:two-component system response regulator HydG